MGSLVFVGFRRVFYWFSSVGHLLGDDYHLLSIFKA